MLHPTVQSPAFLNVNFVQIEKSVSANLVLRTIAVACALIVSNLAIDFALLKIQESLVQLNLVMAMCIIQSTTDIPKKFMLDHIQSGFHFTISHIRSRIVLDGFLHKALDERGHLCDVAAPNRFKELIHSGLQSGMNLHLHGKKS
jgi:hypothetical protein